MLWVRALSSAFVTTSVHNQRIWPTSIATNLGRQQSRVNRRSLSSTSRDDMCFGARRGDLDPVKRWRDENPEACIDDIIDDPRRIPLNEACNGGHLDVVKYLVETCGSNPAMLTKLGATDFDVCPLHYACGGGHMEIAKYLVEVCEVDVNAPDSYGTTALHEACGSGTFDVVKYLVESCNANIYAKDQSEKTALHEACGRCDDDVDILDYLIGPCKMDVTVKNSKGESLLHDAATGGNPNVLWALCNSADLDVNVQDEGGRTPLHCAAAGGHGEMVESLLDIGADCTITTYERNVAAFDMVDDTFPESEKRCFEVFMKHLGRKLLRLKEEEKAKDSAAAKSSKAVLDADDASNSDGKSGETPEGAN